MSAPKGSEVVAYAATFKGVAKGHVRENVNDFTQWYYGDNTSASFCLIGICYVFNHFDFLVDGLGGKIAYVPDLKHRVGGKWHTDKALISRGDPVTFDFNNTGDPEHVGMFVKWLNSSHTLFQSFEFNTTGAGSDDYCGYKDRSWSDVFGFVKPGFSPETSPDTYNGFVYRYVSGHLQSGTRVEWIQDHINLWKPKALKVDGAYGTHTRDAVKAYQTARRLTVDGVVGGQTWNSLAKEKA